MEFLRRVVIELKGRHFDFIKTPEGNYGDIVSVTGGATDILKCLPELTRDFARKIKPEFTRCYGLAKPQQVQLYYTARDPISGVSIRCIGYWDVIHSENWLRFDANFS